MARRNHSIRDALLASSVLLVSGPAMAADVTPERLLNPDKEPQNWLMNHRTYNGQRYSPLARINRDNVKGLRLAYAVPLGGGSGNEYSVATPLAEDGFLYVTDSWGVLYKIDGTSGDAGRIMAHGPEAGASAAQPRCRVREISSSPGAACAASSPPTRKGRQRRPSRIRRT